MKGEPSKIQKYNNLTTQATACERSQDWAYAAKLWRTALQLAQVTFWKDKADWCAKRAAFCEKTLQRTRP